MTVYVIGVVVTVIIMAIDDGVGGCNGVVG